MNLRRSYIPKILLASIVTGSIPFAQASRIDTSQTLFGVEYTFQDQAMVDEPGRNTMSTPHKEQKASAIAYGIAEKLGIPSSTVYSKTTWKPGHFVNVPNDGKWVINSEPVTIEVNTTPRHLDEIAATAKPIFATALENGLVPYVNPAAERSGMGHIHIGAKDMKTNPFFLHPLLLRNVMVYLHKHPSLLYGFAEAYDVGQNSNIETYHIPARQMEFQSAVADFDRWYDKASEDDRISEGFNQFLAALKANDHVSKFFEHYRYMNLQHVAKGAFKPDDSGKLTIEFRNFRPPKNPETAEAFASLLIAVMEKQSEHGHREPFVWINEAQYDRFNTGSKIDDDWATIRRELSLNNRYLDDAILEYSSAIHAQRTTLKDLPESDLFSAYSAKERKGTYYELRLPLNKYPERPNLEINGKAVELEKVKVAGIEYWLGVIDTRALKINAIELLNNRVRATASSMAPICESAF